ncbi:MAG: S1 RNA-binding domain-containing protein, partial [Pseudomonadota bacterium]|nr:S1 RNA-binding domain-containing protein [Pseudomonadota bacterium]
MAKRMLIDALHPEETRVIIADHTQIYHFDFVSAARKQLKGNIYLAKITRVEPSLQAAFVEYGGGKQGFLPFSEIHADYYQIPMSDRKRLMEEAQRDDESAEPADRQQQESPREPESYGEQPIAEPPQESATMEPAAEEGERPAYLTQGAIETAAGEEIEFPENAGVPVLAEGVPADLPSEILAQGEVPAQGEAVVQGEISAKTEGVETIASEEEEIRNRPRRNFFRRYKIQEVIRRGQIVLVQVIKEERGNKGVSLTTYLSLAGRYCVLMPNSPKDGGVSRKIASVDDRKRLKAIYTELKL